MGDIVIFHGKNSDAEYAHGNKGTVVSSQIINGRIKVKWDNDKKALNAKVNRLVPIEVWNSSLAKTMEETDN